MKTSFAPDVRRQWLPGFLANAVIWGASFIFIKIAVERLHPTWVGAGRLITGGVALLIILAVTKEHLPRDKRLWLLMTPVGVFGTAIPFALFAYGEERVSSIVAGMWNATAALWVLPFAVLVYRIEKFTWRGVAGLAVGFAGVLIILGFWNAKGSSLIGHLMCGVAALLYGLTIPYVKRFISGSFEASGVALASVQVVIAATASTIGALVLAGPAPSVTTWGWDVIGSLLALGIFGSGIAFALNIRVLRVAGASTAAYVTYLVPVVAVLLGIVVLGEELTWNLPVGVLIVLAGVAIAQGLLRRKPSPSPTPSPEAAVEEPIPAVSGTR